jgi:RNA polymerase sigma-70 factor (ECF subfamily)
LFEAYAERLFGYCLKRLGCRSEAEDAVQTTFLYAHRALLRGVTPRSEGAWLYTIAKNVCRWQQRTASRRAPQAALDPDTLPAEVAELDSELLRDLDDALASLPERQRQAILLREWRGLSGSEVGSALELSESATHALLTRARRSLAAALTTAGRRPVLGLDFGSLVLNLRSLLVGSGAKAAATAVAIAGVGATGYTVERALVGHDSSPSRQAPHGLPLASPSADARASGRVNVTASEASRRVDAPSVSPRVYRAVVPRSEGTEAPAWSPPAGGADTLTTTGRDTRETSFGTPQETLPSVTTELPAGDVQPDDLLPPLDVDLPTDSTPPLLPAPVLPPPDLPDAPPLPPATDPTGLLP